MMGGQGIGAVGVVLILALAVVVYFLPSMIATHRTHPHRVGIFLLDLLMGWTVIGWVAALVWASIGEPRKRGARVPCPHCRESMDPLASVCPHCRRDIDAVIVRARRSVLGIAAMILLTGCTTHGLIRPLAVEPGASGSLTVIRTWNLVSVGMTYAVSVDHEEIFGIKVGEHATLAVPAGDRLVGVDCGATGEVKYARVKVQPGERYFAHVTPFVCPPVEISEETARPLMERTEMLGLTAPRR
jgi:T4 superinfection immunity protein